MRELISLRAFGMSELEAARMYLALKMADKGLVSAPNAAAGAPFQIGGTTLGTFDAGALAGVKGWQAHPAPLVEVHDTFSTPSRETEVKVRAFMRSPPRG